MTFKQKVYDHYSKIINDKIGGLQNVLDELKESGANETKSTAGDKHETALAMLQIEQANTRGQLNILLDQLATFNKINPEINTETIVVGSLVKTNHAYLFLSIALGKALIDNVAVVALSAQSPLGSKLAGLGKGDRVSINSMVYIIEDVA